MSTFVLVHGAWHGRWCWERLQAELSRRGHETVAMDLPVADGRATFVDYRDAVLAAWPSGAASDGAVLVGHSLGAMVVPLVAAMRPVSASVYLCPVVPNVAGMPWDDAPAMGTPEAYVTVTHPDGSASFDSLDEAVATFYGTCDPGDAAWAFARLQPQNSTSLWDRPYPLTELPPGPRVAVAGAYDQAITPTYLRSVCRTRLGVDPVEIDTDHSPFLSAPAILADLLESVADDRTRSTPG
jgi:pimeloyl-ACP methyl ester carboxylesterase